MEIDIASLGRAFLYLGIGFVLMVFYFQWQWARTCDKNIQVLEAQKGGGGAYKLAPKDGGYVEIAQEDGTVRIWPINELATIDILYPGVGWVPAFLQKSIRLAIVNEGDLEPLLNRSPHRTKVASPDVVAFIEGIAKDNPDLATLVAEFLAGISTGPTREMVADPAILGSLMRSNVMNALATVSDDLMEALKGVRTQLTRVAGINSVYVYGGLGVCIVLSGFIIYQMMQGTVGLPAVPVAPGDSGVIVELNIMQNVIMDKLAAIEGLIIEGLAELP